MTPPDLGFYTVERRACKRGGEEVRRGDVVSGKYGNGIPVQDTCEALDNFAGLASRNTLPLQLVATEQGPIALPVGGVTDVTGVPSVRALEELYSGSTRVSGISDRYYK